MKFSRSKIKKKMYRQIETEEIFYLDNGGTIIPVTTLADEFGGKCQIAIDDHCYVQ